MGRKKLPEDQILKNAGIKVSDEMLNELERLAADWDSKPGTVGRELLLLGYAVYQATQQSAIFTDLIWKGTVSKEELKEKFSLILGGPRKESEKEQLTVKPKAQDQPDPDKRNNEGSSTGIQPNTNIEAPKSDADEELPPFKQRLQRTVNTKVIYKGKKIKG